MKGHGFAGSFFNLKHKCLILPNIKCSPLPQTIFIIDLFSAYLTSVSWDILPWFLLLSKYWYFIRKVSLQKTFFFSMKSEKCMTSKTLWTCCWMFWMFFVMIKNKLILPNGECTSFFIKEKILSSCKLCCLRILQTMACNFPSSPSLSKYWYSFRNFIIFLFIFYWEYFPVKSKRMND